MTMINQSKPVSSVTNSTKPTISVSWATITTTWASETHTWAGIASMLTNVLKQISSIVNISKPA